MKIDKVYESGLNLYKDMYTYLRDNYLYTKEQRDEFADLAYKAYHNAETLGYLDLASSFFTLYIQIRDTHVKYYYEPSNFEKLINRINDKLNKYNN